MMRKEEFKLLRKEFLKEEEIIRKQDRKYAEAWRTHGVEGCAILAMAELIKFIGMVKTGSNNLPKMLHVLRDVRNYTKFSTLYVHNRIKARKGGD